MPPPNTINVFFTDAPRVDGETAVKNADGLLKELAVRAAEEAGCGPEHAQEFQLIALDAEQQSALHRLLRTA